MADKTQSRDLIRKLETIVMSNDPSRAEAKKMLDELNVHNDRIKKLAKKHDSLREELIRRTEDNVTQKEIDIRVELRREIKKKKEELAFAISEFEDRVQAVREKMTK